MEARRLLAQAVDSGAVGDGSGVVVGNAGAQAEVKIRRVARTAESQVVFDSCIVD